MMRRALCILAGTVLALAVLAGCRDPGEVSRVLGSLGNAIGGPSGGGNTETVAGYAASAVKGAAAVAHAAEDFTPEQEYYIGRSVGAALLAKYHPLANPRANAYVNEMGQSLAMLSSS